MAFVGPRIWIPTLGYSLLEGFVTIAYRGWIIISEGVNHARPKLEAMGIKLGSFEPDPKGDCGGRFNNCEVSEAAMEKLNPYWGSFIWGLDPVHESQGKDATNG